MSRIKLMMDVKEDAESLVSSIGILLDALENDEEIEETTAKKEEKTYELEEVRKILADKSRLGHTSKIRELLEKYGGKKLSEIDPSRYEDLVQDVEKL
ncbi:DNA ligase [Facklamia sp. P12950]|uniref:DNA ligase n=1 Tax=Facklamia sp. P12950 TaxID=3421951 RepID=UPI003D1838EF